MHPKAQRRANQPNSWVAAIADLATPPGPTHLPTFQGRRNQLKAEKKIS